MRSRLSWSSRPRSERVAKGRERTAPGNAQRSARRPCTDAGRECRTRAHREGARTESRAERARRPSDSRSHSPKMRRHSRASPRSCASATSSCASRSPNLPHVTSSLRAAEHLEACQRELRFRNETLAPQSQLLAPLDAIGRSRSRRWRSFTQFCSWLFPPTARHLGYIRTYLHLRRSDLFDADYYLSRYPDVLHAGLNPLMHYVEHGRREGRQPRARRRSCHPSFPPLPSRSRRSPSCGSAGSCASTSGLDAAPVVSDGDEALLQYAGCRASHLSQARSGRYPGWLPESSRSAVAQLEAARSRGAEVLVVPESNRWWLEQYVEFARYFERRYVLAVAEAGAGVLGTYRRRVPSAGSTIS